MKTAITVYVPGETPIRSEVELPARPTRDQLKTIVLPLIPNAQEFGTVEHVSVLFEGQRASMFIDEMGHVRKGHPPVFNQKATEIYRASWLDRHPDADADTLHWIAGTAVVFDRNVWF